MCCARKFILMHSCANIDTPLPDPGKLQQGGKTMQPYREKEVKAGCHAIKGSSTTWSKGLILRLHTFVARDQLAFFDWEYYENWILG